MAGHGYADIHAIAKVLAFGFACNCKLLKEPPGLYSLCRIGGRNPGSESPGQEPVLSGEVGPHTRTHLAEKPGRDTPQHAPSTMLNHFNQHVNEIPKSPKNVEAVIKERMTALSRIFYLFSAPFFHVASPWRGQQKAWLQTEGEGLVSRRRVPAPSRPWRIKTVDAFGRSSTFPNQFKPMTTPNSRTCQIGGPIHREDRRYQTPR
jgi:hypothetical protein